MVRELRQEQGLSQEKLAEACGLHRNYVGAIERAERTPTIITAEKLAGALGKTLSDLFSDIERDPDRID